MNELFIAINVAMSIIGSTVVILLIDNDMSAGMTYMIGYWLVYFILKIIKKMK